MTAQPTTVTELIDHANSDARAAVRDYLLSIQSGELTMAQALELVADLNGELKFQDLAAEICRGRLHGYLTRVQAAQWMVWALEMQCRPPEVKCDAHKPAYEPGRGATEINGRLWTHCTWRGGLPPSGMCPKCGSRLPDPRVAAEKHLVEVIAKEQEATT